jgi:hypothetical protein
VVDVESMVLVLFEVVNKFAIHLVLFAWNTGVFDAQNSQEASMSARQHVWCDTRHLVTTAQYVVQLSCRPMLGCGNGIVHLSSVPF